MPAPVDEAAAVELTALLMQFADAHGRVDVQDAVRAVLAADYTSSKLPALTDADGITTPAHVPVRLGALAEAIAQRRGDGLWLTGNDGAEPFENDTFALRAYCWCDGDDAGHEEGCPPNFEHKASGVHVRWYKHAGRGSTVNKVVTADQWDTILASAMCSVVLGL